MRRSYRLCKSCGDIHQVDRWPHNCMPAMVARSDLAAPYVISDALPGGVNGLYHHGVCRKIDNKAGYRRATKESGCIEVGNEHAATRQRTHKPLKEDVIESGVNLALHELGMSSESDMGKLDYGDS